MTPPPRGSGALKARAPKRDPRRPAPASDRPRHLHVVEPGRPAPGRRPPARLVVPAVAATMLALFIVVTVNVLVGQAAMQRAAVEDRVEAKRVAVERLEIGVARLRAPGRIERQALKLGLVPPSDVVPLQPGAPLSARAGSAERGED